MTKCAQPFCGHYHSDIDGICLSNRCSCTPELFIAIDPSNPGYRNFAYHQKILVEMKNLEDKVTHMLTGVEGTRNMTNWEFVITCWRFFFGFHVGDSFSQDLFEKIAKHGEPENIRRCRQKVCHPELETLRIFQEMLKELTKEGRDGSQAYWDLTKQMKIFWMNSKYIPNDIALIKRKGIKESAIFEWSIEELNSIC